MATEQKPPQRQKEQPAAQAAAQTPALVGEERALYFTQADEARKAWKRAEGSGYNVLGGSFVLPNIPEGFAVAMTVLRIDARGMADGGETYKVGDNKLGIAKSAVFKFAAAAGVNFEPSESGRLDDASIEAYCHWHAVATVRDVMTGNVRKIVADKVIDLRPGSTLYRLWQRNAEERAKKWNKPEQAEALFERRLSEFMPHITSMAETKAQLRCIRAALGIQSGYSAAALAKPFVLPVLVIAPETIKDPATRERMIEMRLAHAMGIGQVLYPQRPSTAALTPPQQPIAPTPPPPVRQAKPPRVEQQPPPAEPEQGPPDTDDMEDIPFPDEQGPV